MAQLNRSTLEAFFETGDKPTQEQFTDLIESCVNIIDDNPILSSVITIPTAQVLTLNSSPITLIESPGANKAIEVTSASSLLTYNSITYAPFPDIEIKTETAIYDQFVIAKILGSTATRHLIGVVFSKIITTVDGQIIPDEKLLATTSVDPGVGNSDIVIYTSYKIIDIP